MKTVALFFGNFLLKRILETPLLEGDIHKTKIIPPTPKQNTTLT